MSSRCYFNESVSACVYYIYLFTSIIKYINLLITRVPAVCILCAIDSAVVCADRIMETINEAEQLIEKYNIVRRKKI